MNAYKPMLRVPVIAASLGILTTFDTSSIWSSWAR